MSARFHYLALVLWGLTLDVSTAKIFQGWPDRATQIAAFAGVLFHGAGMVYRIWRPLP